MQKEERSLKKQIEDVAKRFLEKIKDSEIQVISHFDTDGITSATIMAQTLKKLEKSFALKIVKNLDEEVIRKQSKNKVTVFLDLASNSIHHIITHNLNNVFIINHHQIIQNIPDE